MGKSGKSLTEAARSVLLKEGGIPSVSSSDTNPDRDATSTTVSKSSLKPKTASCEPDPKHNEAEDLGGATVTSTPKENLGAKAAKSKDTSKSSTAAVSSEPMKKLSEEESDEALDEEVEAYIDAMIEEGHSEEEIMKSLEELYEETPDEDDTGAEVSEELESFINTMIEDGHSEEDISKAVEENFELVSEEDETPSEEEEEEAPIQKVDMSEHVEALLEGEDLSDEFRQKATTIFESAVNQKINEELEVIEEAYAKSLEEEVSKIQESLTEQVDDYLNYVIEQWVSENEVAIESGLKSELTEDFISGLRNLFAEHYIDIPEEKVTVIEELGNELEELRTKLNEEIDKNVLLNKMVGESKQAEIFASVVDGLTQTQTEKLKALAEGIEYKNQEEYDRKITTLRENYFPTKTKSQPLDAAESADDGKGMLAETLKGPMASYVKTLNKSLPN
jgi:DNA-binding transcriptional regulator YhcF (GntR family)